MAEMLKLDNIHKTFNPGTINEKVALNGVNLTLEEGDFVTVIGGNGAGKSTLMRTLLNLQQPIHGKITFGAGVKSDEIGYLPQQTVIQKDFPASVREIVLSGCQNRVGRGL